MNSKPLLSIITPTKNRGEMISRAIESVIDQNIDEIEHIIIDGNSSDNTREVVLSYPSVKFYSEPDKGLYFALNKGIQLAQGEYIGWLNSDDYYAENALKPALDLLLKNKNIMGVFGAARIHYLQDNKPSINIPHIKCDELLHRVALDAFPINAFIFKRSVFEQLNYFDTDYSIAADRDFIFRFGLSENPYLSLSQVLYIYRSHPTSITLGGQVDQNIQSHVEEMKISLKIREKLVGQEDLFNLCTKWHSRASRDAVLRNIKQLKIKETIFLMKTGSREDNEWMNEFVKVFLLRLKKLFNGFARSRRDS